MKKKPGSGTSPRKTSKKGPSAIALLKADHKKVKALFKEFEALKKAEASDAKKAAVVKLICEELTVHTQVEEEVFYPTVRAALDDDDLMDEADIEHEVAKGLIAQLKAMKPGDDHYDARVTVLGEAIDHHVKEEHEEMFPKAAKAKVDMIALGEQIAARKKKLK
jgi:hypothetical protein